MRKFFFIAAIAASVCFAVQPGSRPRTIAAFETSEFCKKLGRFKKSSWTLKTGGTNNSYTFVDPDNGDPQPSLGVELTTEGARVTSIGLGWSPYSGKVRWTPKKEEQIAQLLAFWGVGDLTSQVVEFAKNNYRKNCPNSVGASPRTRIGPISAQCGQTAGDVYLCWK